MDVGAAESRKLFLTMRNFLRYLFSLEKKPRKGLLAYEWAMLAYLLFTLVFIAVTYTKIPHANLMMVGRFKVAAVTIAMWGVYRMLPCGLTMLARAVVQMSLLSWWYPDLFELNRHLPNLDHLFASWEQAVFHCQPALLFSQVFSHGIFSELMCLGYYSYYPMMLVVAMGVLFYKREHFERIIFIILASFFIHYVIFIFLPVSGPQFYYEAVGMDKIAQGVFPNIYDHFNFQQVRMECPGFKDGIFYALVEQAHQAGERPVAAFPSSHVSITVVLMFIAWRMDLRKVFWTLLPFAVLLFFSTVYIRAHYAIDAFAGLVSGALCYFLLEWATCHYQFGKKGK